ncbi:MAG: protein kinase domain-containing protein [Candidatus Woesearchaeota archaeon]
MIEQGSLSFVYEDENEPYVYKKNESSVDTAVLDTLLQLNDPRVLSPLEYTKGKFVIELYPKIQAPPLVDYFHQTPDLDKRDIANIMIECSLATRTLHENNICHRDIHLGNFFWNNQKALIFDYNRSSFMGPNTHDYRYLTPIQIREIQESCPQYPQEEFLFGHPITEKYDIYSLAVLFESLTTPWASNRKLTKIISRAKQPFPKRTKNIEQFLDELHSI